MSFSYDPSGQAGRVRLAIADTNASSYVFEDAEISAFLAQEGSVRLATAAALESMASAMRAYKVSKVLDVELANVPDIQKSLLAQAKQIRAVDVENGAGFAIAEQVVNGRSRTQRLYKQAQREGLA